MQWAVMASRECSSKFRWFQKTNHRKFSIPKITVLGGGYAGLAAAYFLHRAGKDVTVLEWSRGLGGRASTRNVGYRTMDSGAQRLDLTPLSVNKLETDARALLRAVVEERGGTPHLKPFPGPVWRFDGRSISTAEQVEVPNWSYFEGG